MGDFGVSVRPARVSDAAAIGSVHAGAWLAAYSDVFDPAFLARAAEGRRLGWRDPLARFLAGPGLVLVAERDGVVGAFAHAAPAGDGADARAEILAFYASPSEWGTGTAAVLMDAVCVALARDWRDVVLWTLAAPTRARGFYEKAGFTATGRVRDELLTDWSGSAEAVRQPAVEYAKSLRP